MKITVAITTYNRASMITQCLVNIATHPMVEEIIICDDASTDIAELRKQVRLMQGKMPSRILLIENAENVGSFKNKVRAIGHCHKGWVILLDSDNILDYTYLEQLRGQLRDETHVLLPEIAYANFQFPITVVTKSNVAKHIADDGLFPVLMNTGNFCFHTDLFHKAMPFVNIDPAGSCSIYFNYLFLKAGASLHVVKGMKYFHRMHEQSHWLATMDESQRITKILLDEMRTW